LSVPHTEHAPVAPLPAADDGGTTYDSYVRASTLHRLQHPHTSEPAEMAFLVSSQIMELYFGLIRFELTNAQRAARGDDVATVVRFVRRAVAHYHGLNASWHSLSWLTPGEYGRFRDALDNASGLQSQAYRHVSFLLGEKSRSLASAHRADVAGHRDLIAALESPSLYDDVLAVLHRCGYPMPAAVTDRDLAADYQPHPAVEAAWAAIYRDERPDSPLLALAEALTDLAEAASRWRYRHLTAVRRVLGDKRGTAGSAGVAWLEGRVNRMFFPELWSARTDV
jgi:tryptophan 2,3-dioxygenase